MKQGHLKYKKSEWSGDNDFKGSINLNYFFRTKNIVHYCEKHL